MRLRALAGARRRRWPFLLLYVSEGAPIGYLWWAMPTRLRVAGVAIDDITALTAALTLPWAFKMLWAPVVDAYSERITALRWWIGASQVGMGVALLPLLALEPSADYSGIVTLLLVHSFFAATQDIAIDALAVRGVPPAERGGLTAWMQIGMLAGRSLFGGGALLLERWIGAGGVVIGLVATVWSCGAIGLAATRDHDFDGQAERARRSVVGITAEVLSRPATWIGLLFAATAGVAMDGVGAVAGPLLLLLDFSQDEVGLFFAVPAVVGMAIGALAGGMLSDRRRRSRVAAAAIVATSICVAAQGAALAYGIAEARWTVVALLALGYVLFGLVTSSSYAVLMDLTERRLAAVQFSTFMGGVNLCYVWSAWLIGSLAASRGYATALGVVSVLSVPALVALLFIERRGAQLGSGD